MFMTNNCKVVSSLEIYCMSIHTTEELNIVQLVIIIIQKEDIEGKKWQKNF